MTTAGFLPHIKTAWTPPCGPQSPTRSGHCCSPGLLLPSSLGSWWSLLSSSPPLLVLCHWGLMAHASGLSWDDSYRVFLTMHSANFGHFRKTPALFSELLPPSEIILLINLLIYALLTVFSPYITWTKDSRTDFAWVLVPLKSLYLDKCLALDPC